MTEKALAVQSVSCEDTEKVCLENDDACTSREMSGLFNSFESSVWCKPLVRESHERLWWSLDLQERMEGETGAFKHVAMWENMILVNYTRHVTCRTLSYSTVLHFYFWAFRCYCSLLNPGSHCCGSQDASEFLDKQQIGQKWYLLFLNTDDAIFFTKK